MIRILALILCICLGGMLGPTFGEAAVNARIIINKSINKLAYYQDGKLVKVFPVATGRVASYTPEGSFAIANKFVDPAYIKGGIPGGSPANPLGPRWMGLSAGGGTYGIHGNSDPSSIGTYASGGCIRMFDEDVTWLYDRIAIGTPVDIVNRLLDFKAQEQLPEAKLRLNGEAVKLPQGAGPAFSTEQLLLPFRHIVGQLGYQFQWDGLSKTMTIAAGENQFICTLDSKSCTINLTKKNASQVPVIHSSYTYLPLYFFEQILGTDSPLNEESKAVLETVNPLQIGKPVSCPMDVKVGSQKLSLNGEETPLLFGNHVLVPVKPVGEALGLEVNWNEAREGVFIRDKEKNLLILPKDSNSGMLNGEDFDICPRIVIRNGQTFVAADDLARAFKLKVNCDFSSGSINIS